MELLIIWIVTTLSLLVISRIGLFGVDIEDFGTALVVAVVLGLSECRSGSRPQIPFLSPSHSDLRTIQRLHQRRCFLADREPRKRF